MALLFCSYILNWANSSKEELKIKLLASFTLISLLSFYVYQPIFSLSSINLNGVVGKYKYVKNTLLHSYGKETEGSVYSLKEYITKVQVVNKLTSSEMALFIPKPVVLNQIIKTNDGRENFYTMNIYAITGIQLINGLIGNERAYGLINYGEKSTLKDSINYNYECSRLGVKALIIVDDYSEKHYSSYLCDE